MKIIIPPAAAGMRLLDYLAKQGYVIPADCAGKGTCGKCKVKVTDGMFLRTGKTIEKYIPDEKGEILACHAKCTEGGAEILLSEISGEGLALDNVSVKTVETEKDNAVCCYAFALDIGTTTLAAALIDTVSGETVSTFSCLNPQKSFGADVISRIRACTDGKLEIMTTLIRNGVNGLLNECIRLFPEKLPLTLAVAGNPTMLHIFCGISPAGIGVYPFMPVFTETKRLSGKELGLSVERVVILPSISSFLGSDVTCGVLVSGMLREEAPTILIDIGTNGEIVLCRGTKGGNGLLASSTAAGPALEGAGISCGMGGVAGAICDMKAEDNDTQTIVRYRTVGDAPPVGICGSGLIDLIALLLKFGIIDETGYLEEGSFRLETSDKFIFHHTNAKGNIFSQSSAADISISQKDIREFQLAKSAIRAGLDILISNAGFDIKAIGRIYLAGGLGFYMNPVSAAEVGILPKEILQCVKAVGNTSLAGAKAFLCKENYLYEMEEFAADCKVYELNLDPAFSDAFAENMLFPEE